MANTTNPGDIRNFSISSNTKDFSIDISASISEFRYFESVLSNTITATAVVIDTGVVNNKDKDGLGTLIDYLPLRGGERVDITILDYQENEMNMAMFVNRVRNSTPGTQQELFIIDLCSAEHFFNEQVRISKRFSDAPISDHVVTIAESIGIPEASIEVDVTGNPYNFYGNDRKPFYLLTWLASKSIPERSGTQSGLGGTAGYLFYQTIDKFYFKSIDNLLKQQTNKNFVFTNTTTNDSNFDGKILKYNINSDIDIQQNLSLGVYSNRTIFFDPYSFSYKVQDFNIDEQKSSINTAGSSNASSLVNRMFYDIPGKPVAPTRIMTSVMDVGWNLAGKGDAQLSNNTTESGGKIFATTNDQTTKNLVQSIMRYNQLFTIQTEITVPGDFSLRAGQMIHCTFPEISRDKNLQINKETSGNYLIAHVCHRSTPTDTFTSLTLVRDSYGERD